MRIFLDTADIDEIREAARWGILSGVTTNPTLVGKTHGQSHEELIREIAEIVDGPISAETISLETAGMVEEGRRFAKWHPNVVVKVPSTPNGWAAVKQLKSEGIRTNVTLCFSANQALFAALAGAYIISPFVGRLDDISEDGMQVVRDIVEIYRETTSGNARAGCQHSAPAAYHRRRQSRCGHRHRALQGSGAGGKASADRQGH